MGTSAVDIPTVGLLLGYLLLILPITFILYVKVDLLKDLVVSVLRMTLQLLFVSLYLRFVFDLNTWWLNIFWLVVMILAADISLVSSSKLQLRRFMLPILLSLFVGTGVPLLYFLSVIIRLPHIMDAQYFIPIAGMIMGNSLRADIIGLRTFYTSIQNEEKAYLLYLSQGASLGEAVHPFLKRAYSSSLAPTIATMATIGLVSLPGMMTGIILGGTDPVVAIKYQIAIMIAIFTGTALAVFLGITFTLRAAFDRYGVLDKNIFSRGKG